MIPKQGARPLLSTLMHLTYLAIHWSVPIITQYTIQFRTCVNISATLNIHPGVASRVIDGMMALAGLGGNYCACRKEDIATCPCRCRCYWYGDGGNCTDSNVWRYQELSRVRLCCHRAITVALLLELLNVFRIHRRLILYIAWLWRYVDYYEGITTACDITVCCILIVWFTCVIDNHLDAVNEPWPSPWR